MVELPSGKMKSREGTVVDADDLMDELAALCAEAGRERCLRFLRLNSAHVPSTSHLVA